VQIIASSWIGLQPKNKTKQKLDRFKLTRITSKQSVSAKTRLNFDDLASAETVTDSANWMLQQHD
jgi:hypothetical protein